jgi:penicillin-insensitive murein endopeptidase
MNYWFTDAVLHPKPSPPPSKPPRQTRMSDLPSACHQVLMAP